MISIHALFAEGDSRERRDSLRSADFYPRPLRRGRPRAQGEAVQEAWISIHALFAEGDRTRCCVSARPTDFYPRPLRRGRRSRSTPASRYPRISIHALFAEGDGIFQCEIYPAEPISIHALFAEGDHEDGGARHNREVRFLSTPSSQRATLYAWFSIFSWLFLSTPSSQRATREQ